MKPRSLNRAPARAAAAFAVIVAAGLAGACGVFADPAPSPLLHGGEMMNMKLESEAFRAGNPIPTVYTCKGQSLSPPLSWQDVPDGTQTLALIADDPDAPMGTWVHWVVYNIPADRRSFKQSVDKTDSLPDGTRQGKNSSGSIGYQGPCPPSGTHRYFFKLYALDTTLDMRSAATKQDLLDAMDGHVLAYGELMGTFSH